MINIIEIVCFLGLIFPALTIVFYLLGIIEPNIPKPRNKFDIELYLMIGLSLYVGWWIGIVEIHRTIKGDDINE